MAKRKIITHWVTTLDACPTITRIIDGRERVLRVVASEILIHRLVAIDPTTLEVFSLPHLGGEFSLSPAFPTERSQA